MLPFGRRGDTLVSVNDVERGLQKDVVCPSCKTPLVARKGRVRSHYFAHYTGADCPAALQTMLHMRAKEIIAEEKQIFLPGHSIYVSGLQKLFPITNPQMVDVKKAELESRLGGIIPDVIVTTTNDVEVLVEIKVSHAVEQPKIDLMRKGNLRAIEVDLSDLHKNGYDEKILRERLIVQHDRKKWLSSPKFNAINDYDLTLDIYKHTLQIPFRFLSSRHKEILCPATDSLFPNAKVSDRMRRLDANACYICEYYLGIYGNGVVCGYKEKITDYDSFQLSKKKMTKRNATLQGGVT